MEGHSVELEFDGGGVFMRLIHPENGCDPPSVCASCGRYAEEPEGQEPCYDCPKPDDGCWLQGWADNLAADELLKGTVIVPISPEWAGDHAVFHIPRAARSSSGGE